MQTQVDIGFDQLLRIVKKLPVEQLRKLKAQIDQKVDAEKSKIDLLALLLKGPVATKKQLKTISNNRKAINQWRTK
jgi:hypothetical protein